MTGHPIFKKCVQHFYILHLDTSFQCVVLGVGKYKFFLNVTLLCVVMCGDRRGLAHCNVLIMFILGVVHLIFTKPNSKKEKDCLVKRWDQHFLMYKIKRYQGQNGQFWGGIQIVSQYKTKQRKSKSNKTQCLVMGVQPHIKGQQTAHQLTLNLNKDTMHKVQQRTKNL